jgi:hypothetical protein
MPPARRKTAVAFGIGVLEGVGGMWIETATDIDKCSIYDPTFQRFPEKA